MSSFAEKYGKKSSNNMSAEALKQEKTSFADMAQQKSTNIGDLAQKKQQSATELNTKSANADLIYLVKGVDDNRNAWYYVLVDRLKVSLFLKALNDDIIHLENYGEILYSAYGDHPPKEITNKIKEEYGVSDA